MTIEAGLELAQNMVSYGEIETAVAAVHLAVLGGFHQEEPGSTLLLLGPGTGFWGAFSGSEDYADPRPDPMDRWSSRVVGQLAHDLGAEAIFPFGGPPHHPFYSWALETGRVWASPIAMLVHAEDGLMVSFRGALRFDHRVDLPEPPPIRPCDDCAAPCTTACPVGALTPEGYDVPRCKAYLDTPEGATCMRGGCQARMACPLSAGVRKDAQNAFHMANFHPPAAG